MWDSGELNWRSKNWGRRRGFLELGRWRAPGGRHQHLFSGASGPILHLTSRPHPSLGPSHALYAPLLTPTSPSGKKAAFSFPSDLQVLVNRVLQRCLLLRNHLHTPYTAKFRARLRWVPAGICKGSPNPATGLAALFKSSELGSLPSRLEVQLLGRSPP